MSGLIPDAAPPAAPRAPQGLPLRALCATNWDELSTAYPLWAHQAAGLVRLSGLAAKGAALVPADVIVILPTGWRPPYERIFACACLVGYTEVRVATSGAVYIQAGGSATWTSLDGIQYEVT